MGANFRIAAALAVALTAGDAAAQTNYPQQSIHILVGFTPGVAPDITSRSATNGLRHGRSRSWSRT
jgi:tripartite-type tricarboxylate transporter receptor subunit TctC